MHAAAELVHPSVGRQTLLAAVSAAVRQHRLGDVHFSLGDCGARLALATFGTGASIVAVASNALASNVVLDEATLWQALVETPLALVGRSRPGRSFRSARYRA